MDAEPLGLRRVFALNIRVRFEKHGPMKYIGHLDIMRYFQKAIKRAEIDIAYSEGFNPHQIMSFAAPLGVGITSSGEYIDLGVNTTMSSKAAIDALNSVMVEDIVITGYKLLPDNTPNAMSAVAAADYVVTSKNTFSSVCSHKKMLDDKSRWFDEAKELIVTKPTKKGTADVDLKALVYNFEIESDENSPVFKLFLASGSENNIKPDFVIEKFYEYIKIPFDVLDFNIHRNDIYTKVDDKLVSLNDVGEEIV